MLSSTIDAAPCRRRRAALYCPTPDLPQGGGAERVMMTVAGELARRGVDVRFIVNRMGPCWDQLSPDVRLVNLRTHRRTALLGLLRHIRAEQPDVLFSTCLSGNLNALLARWLNGARVRTVIRPETCLSRYLSAPTMGRRVFARLLRRLLPAADAVIVQCPAMADDVLSFAPGTRGKVTAINNPHDIPAIVARALEPCDHPWLCGDRDEPTILTAARLLPIKDLPTLLRAFAVLTGSRPARLVILGDGPERERLEGLAHRLGIAPRVDFAGHQANPYAYMARADCFALSSINEGLGNVLVEAMACGTPVASTDYPVGARDILDGGRLGGLSPVGDHEALARSIAAILDAPPDPAILRAAALEYDLPASIDRHISVLGLA